MKRLLVGIGHPYRNDDAIGPRLSEMAAGRLPAATIILTHHGEGTGLMELWHGFSEVVLADATCSGSAPGTVRVWDAVAAPLPAGLFPKGSHLFGVAEGVELARRLGRLPAALSVVGIEGSDFTAGQSLSPDVEAAIPLALERLAACFSR
jgi:hydrogenase maturation protease